jgi:hypothetical protein
MAKIKSQNKMLVSTPAEAEALMELVRHSARKVHDWVAAQVGDPLDMLERMKFERVGFHPIEHYELNLVEQINQTWRRSRPAKQPQNRKRRSQARRAH